MSKTSMPVLAAPPMTHSTGPIDLPLESGPAKKPVNSAVDATIIPREMRRRQPEHVVRSAACQPHQGGG